MSKTVVSDGCRRLFTTRFISIVSKPIDIVVVVVVIDVIFVPQKLGPKNVWSQKLGPKNQGQNFFDPKQFWVQKI